MAFGDTILIIWKQVLSIGYQSHMSYHVLLITGYKLLTNGGKHFGILIHIGCSNHTLFFLLENITLIQNVDRFPDLQEDIKMRGYNGIWKVNVVGSSNIMHIILLLVFVS